MAESLPKTNVSHEPCMAAASQAVRLTLSRCVEALAKLRDIEALCACVQETDVEMILVRCRSGLTFQQARERIIPLWQAEVVRGDVSLHVVDDTSHGLDFKFAILYDDGSFLTGRIVVETIAT